MKILPTQAGTTGLQLQSHEQSLLYTMSVGQELSNEVEQQIEQPDLPNLNASIYQNKCMV